MAKKRNTKSAPAKKAKVTQKHKAFCKPCSTEVEAQRVQLLSGKMRWRCKSCSRLMDSDVKVNTIY